LIDAFLPAKSAAMGADRLNSWLEANADGLLIGFAFGAALAVVLLLLRRD